MKTVIYNPESADTYDSSVVEPDVTVLLDTSNECHRILPRLADYLLRLSVDNEEIADFEAARHCEDRAAAMRKYLHNLRSNTPCNFMLSPGEAALAPSLLTGDAIMYFTDEPGVSEAAAAERRKLAIQIGCCLGNGWMQLNAASSVSSAPQELESTSFELAMVH
jgi:hypothetical protein